MAFEFKFGTDTASSGAAAAPPAFSLAQAAGGSSGGGASFSFGGSDAKFDFGSVAAGTGAAAGGGGAASGGMFNFSTTTEAKAEDKKEDKKEEGKALFAFGTGTASNTTTDSAGSASGLTFGAPAAGTGAATSGGATFSFGTGATEEKSSGTGGLTFGTDAGTGAAASTDAAASTTTASVDKIVADTASRIKNRTVEEIIALWNKDLEDHIAAFTEQALEVRKWDQQLIENGNKIIGLQKSVQACQLSQVKLNRVLQTIKIHQQDLLQMVDQLEKVASESMKQFKPGSDEIKRAEAYKIGEEVDAQLMQMSDSLLDTVKKLNQASDRSLDPSNPLTQIIKILNVQMNSLQWIEDASADLEDKLRKSHALLRQARPAAGMGFGGGMGGGGGGLTWAAARP